MQEGVGKTRLALRLAAQVAKRYPDGTRFVELAAMTDARLVPEAIASALGLSEQAGGSAFNAVIRALASKRLLLVLDNAST